MKLPSKSNAISSAVVLCLATVLIALAALQYRWSREVSDAASARMKASLQASMVSFRQDLYHELAALCLAFQVNPDAGSPEIWTRFGERLQTWARSAAHPALVDGVFVLDTAEGKRPRLLRLNPSTSKFEAGDWPSSFGLLAERLSAASTEFAFFTGRFNPAETTRAAGPEHSRSGAAGARPPAPLGEVVRRRPFGGPWAVEQNIPALLHPLFSRVTRAPGAASPPQTIDWVVIQLDQKVLQEQLHELSDRYFSGPAGLEYEVAVVGGIDRRQVIFSSDVDFGTRAAAAADASMELFGAPPGPPGPTRGMLLPGSAGAENRFAADRARDRAEVGLGVRFEPVHYAVGDKDWLLVVKHRKGSLDAVVAGMRRRNLAISFGVLLVLAATMGMIIIASQRAHRLARLQMDFVAGVSHELRTPLAVISSAADNLADGIVESKQQLVRYGTVIRKQARQLGQLVEQILLFAATRQNRLQYSLRPLAVSDVIGHALNDTSDLVHGAKFTVEKTIEPNLPAVTGDLPAVSQCLQNLITNAVKYGGEDHWIGVRAVASQEQGRPRVSISVEDHGAGIEHADLRRIFEPFYRSAEAQSAQIHGSGLGLTLARSIAEAMGGSLTATSERGKGSCFTLHLRVAEDLTPTPEPEEEVAVSPDSRSSQAS